MNLQDWPSDWAVLLVAFEPNSSQIMEWKSLVERGVPLWIWNNSPQGKDGQAERELWHDFPQDRMLGALDHGGLGQALPLAWAALHARGFGRALYLDQDAVWSIRTLEWIGAYWTQLGERAMNYPWVQFRGKSTEYQSILNVSDHDQGEGTLQVPDMDPGGSSIALPTPSRLVMTNGVWVDIPRSSALAGAFVPFHQDALDYQWCWEWFQRGVQVAWVSGCPDLHHPLWVPGRELVFMGRKWRFKDSPTARRQAFLRNLSLLARDAFVKGQGAWAWTMVRNLLSDRVYAVLFGILSKFCTVSSIADVSSIAER